MVLRLDEVTVTLLVMLGDDRWCYLVIDREEWTNPRYAHQN